MKLWLDCLEKCRGVKQLSKHHPEGDVLTHSMQVFQYALWESDDYELIVAALLHDVGKSISSRGHEKHGVEMLGGTITAKTEWLILNHMRFWYWIAGKMTRRMKSIELPNNPWFPDLARLARWDKMGRIEGWKIVYNRKHVRQKLDELRWK